MAEMSGIWRGDGCEVGSVLDEPTLPGISLPGISPPGTSPCPPDSVTAVPAAPLWATTREAAPGMDIDVGTDAGRVTTSTATTSAGGSVSVKPSMASGVSATVAGVVAGAAASSTPAITATAPRCNAAETTKAEPRRTYV